MTDFGCLCAYLIRLIEEILYARAQTTNNAKRVSKHIEPKHQHVHLLDRLPNKHALIDIHSLSLIHFAIQVNN